MLLSVTIITLYSWELLDYHLLRQPWLLSQNYVTVDQTSNQGNKGVYMLQVVLIGPYEHHSNILPWKESGAKVHTISQTKTGQIDLVDLEEKVLVSKFHVFGS